MWARVSRIEGASAEGFDEAMRQMEDQIVPAARQLEGFKGVLSLATADRRTGVTITFWESQEALAASEEAANKLRGQAASVAAGEITGVERFEVVLDQAPVRA